MLFNSFVFFIFLGIVVPVYCVLPKKWRMIHLLISSYLFYGYWDWRFCLLLAFSTLIDFFIGIYLYKADGPKLRKILVSISLFCNLGVLGFFKYFNFFADSMSVMCNRFNIHLDFLHVNVLLPVGVSFYTFQALSYTISVYRKDIKPVRSLIDFSVFIAFFPQLVAGPMERIGHLLPQLQKRALPTQGQVIHAATFICTGLFRKVMIGDTAGRIVDHLFAQPKYYSSPELLMGLLLFSVQIYMDFSGYSFIAKGTAKFFGVDLMDNFAQPYFSPNITEFWRRWHISLSTWMRDFIYISLGGNRKGNFRANVNLWVTMLLAGLWHGAQWKFVFWGALHAIYITVHRMMLTGKKKPERYPLRSLKNRSTHWLKVMGTFMLVLIAWLLFRVENLDSLVLFVNKMAVWEGSPYTLRIVMICAVFIGITLFFDWVDKNRRRIFDAVPPYMRVGICVAMFCATFAYMFSSTPMPFVYFQF